MIKYIPKDTNKMLNMERKINERSKETRRPVERPKDPSADQQTNKNWSVYRMESHKKEILTHVTPWMTLEDDMLSETSWI